jgi:hypothetical protein
VPRDVTCLVRHSAKRKLGDDVTAAQWNFLAVAFSDRSILSLSVSRNRAQSAVA